MPRPKSKAVATLKVDMDQTLLNELDELQADMGTLNRAETARKALKRMVKLHRLFSSSEFTIVRRDNKTRAEQVILFLE